MTVFATETQVATKTWTEVNRNCLRAELHRLRLLLQRRVLWLRRQWQHDPLQNYQGLVISDAQADWLLAGEDRQAESRFYREDPEAAAISRSIAETERELAEQAQALMEAGTPPALEVLVHLFGLTPFERDVLLLCLAPELDPTFERLYAYVQDDVSRKYATPHLALTLFGGEDEPAARNSFLPEAPLRRFRLVSLERSSVPATIPGARPLCLDERIADYLRGVNRLDERVADLLRPMPPALLAPLHCDLVDRLARAIESGACQGPWPALNLMGPSGAGKRAVARALCDRLGLQLYGLDARRLPAPGPERQEMMRLLEREAVLLQMALYLDAAELDPADKAKAASLDDVIERLGVFLIVGSRERWQTEREMVAVLVPKPDAGAQRALWQQALVGVQHSLDGHIEAIVQQFDFGPQAIAQVVVTAKGRARLRAPKDGASLTADDLWQACREQAGWQLDELAQRIIPCYTWEDIVLPEDVFRQLQEIAAQVANRSRVYETWGFGAKLSRGRGISALFSGPSGTGKTMAAEILANHLKLDLYRIDLAGVVSKYIGETEKNLRKVFDAAEQTGAILFFDEADALFGKRTEVKDSHDRYANIEVNYLLQRMEDYRGLAILATNRKSALDRAFLRRLRFLVDFPFPDAESRRRIWQKVFPPQAAVDGLDYAFLARLEIPGGNIKNIALNAAFLAAGEGVPIGMAHVMHAARREYAKIDKLITEAEFGPYYRLVKP
jgi:ATP-dependent 26S proteasome regulatory subunit